LVYLTFSALGGNHLAQMALVCVSLYGIYSAVKKLLTHSVQYIFSAYASCMRSSLLLSVLNTVGLKKSTPRTIFKTLLLGSGLTWTNSTKMSTCMQVNTCAQVQCMNILNVAVIGCCMQYV